MSIENKWVPATSTGDFPLASFGHTATAVNKTKVILFGGATGDSGKFAMTSDTYLFNLFKNDWTKLKGIMYTII